jgi:hypothetical protein
MAAHRQSRGFLGASFGLACCVFAVGCSQTEASHAPADATLDHTPPVDAPPTDATTRLPDGPTTEGDTGGEDDSGVVGPTTRPDADAATPAYELIVDEATIILGDLKQTKYDHTTYIDETTGTFDVDCSGLVNFVLEQVVPEAFAELQQASATRPLAEDYVTFMAAPPPAAVRWHKVSAPSALVPGDIIAWTEPKSVDSSDTGHVMIVVAPPVSATGELDIKVFDSTDTPHGPSDPRTVSGTTGVGEGSVAITVDASGAATGFRWAIDKGVIAYTTPVSLGCRHRYAPVPLRNFRQSRRMSG